MIRNASEAQISNSITFLLQINIFELYIEI